MKQVSTLNAFESITDNYHNKLSTVVRAEWKMNRFFNTVVDNTPSETQAGYDVEYFPIDSITESSRPTSGICKAITNHAIVEPEYTNTIPSKRYYISSPDDVYSYWQSPVATDTSGTFPLLNATNFPAAPGETIVYDNLTCVRPQVIYSTEEDNTGASEPVGVKVNKIEFTVENAYTYPTDYDVQIKATANGAWTTVASNLPILTNGKVQLLYTGTNWIVRPEHPTAAQLSNSITLVGVRLVVRKMFVPTLSRNIMTTRTLGSTMITSSVANGEQFSSLDIGATVTGTGIAAGTKIVSVSDLKEVITETEVEDGYGQTVRLKDVTGYYSEVVLSAPVTQTSTSNITISGSPQPVFFNLIELGACLEQDLSADTASWSDSFSMGEVDFITPLGNISSNEGQVVLWNGDDAKYRNDNAASPYFNLLDKGVLFKGWTNYDGELIKDFEMYSDSWSQSDDVTTVSLIDDSNFLMQTKPPAVMYQNISVQEAIWRICDIIGFNKYKVSNIDTTSNISIFWTDGEKTAWEIFGELSRATQTAIYCDAFGVLNIKTRDTAWDNTKPYNFHFIRDTIPGGRPSNIITLNENTQYEANKVTVSWQPTSFSEQRDNIFPEEVLWEPDGDVVLRSTPLANSLLIADEAIYLKTKEGQTWPWKGFMNVEGEWISFDAKEYIHYEGNVRKTTWVEDFEQQQKLDSKAGPFHRHLNGYTGALRVETRGLWGTEVKDHYIDLTWWTKTRRKNYTDNTSPCSGIKQNPDSSSVTIASPVKNDNNYTYLHRGGRFDEGARYLGFRMKIDKTSHTDKVGGLFFAADGGIGSGYFLEVMATSRMNGKMRNTRNEVVFYSMKPDGKKKQFGGNETRTKDKSGKNRKPKIIKTDVGVRLAAPADKWIDFDIWISDSGSNHKIQIFANGKFLMEAVVGGEWKHTNSALSGLYVRGHSSLTFDHFYAINSAGNYEIDSESYYDRINGGFYSTQASDWTFDTRNAVRKVRYGKKKKKTKNVKYEQKYKQRFFDDFGPTAHELREFDVKFKDSLPALSSRLYFSNTSQLVCTEYVGSIVGGKFIMGNISNRDAMASGEDLKTWGGNGVTHKLFVYGRPVIQKDAQEIEKEDSLALRRRGPIELEYSSSWIQSESEAERFAEWLTTHWTESDSSLELEVYGNPLIELTDIVRVTYGHKDAVFYVTGVSNSYENGLSTTLTLRKAGSL